MEIDILHFLFIDQFEHHSIIIIHSHFHRDIIGIDIIRAIMKYNVFLTLKRGDSPVKLSLYH